ncbi:hypothetical protein EJ08DRAFT_679329 [Tothia fuscella]|uniref:Uncharacterized protein n=1 Tax=Tothia fuscella TaxID=1048955 RepID=A0A9P4TYW6_9PEZI|nr:hypothetical protein EJ08DRAFT_679329 [Tothia fuscella]
MKIAFTDHEKKILENEIRKWDLSCKNYTPYTAGALLELICKNTTLLQAKGGGDLQTTNKPLWLKYGRDLHIGTKKNCGLITSRKLKDPQSNTCLPLAGWTKCKSIIDGPSMAGRDADLILGEAAEDFDLKRELGSKSNPMDLALWVVYAQDIHIMARALRLPILSPQFLHHPAMFERECPHDSLVLQLMQQRCSNEK